MSVVNEGYRTLKDPVLREEYRKKYVAHMKAKRQQEKVFIELLKATFVVEDKAITQLIDKTIIKQSD